MEQSPASSIPPVIPALRDAGKQHVSRTHRTVVICLDGTGDEFDADNSNVVKFFAALKKDDPTQLTYYQSGVGTYSDSYKGSLQSGLSAALDMAVGASLGSHVREAYSFLMQNYREGDKICLIGFSRGAYTARALAGMLHKVGLLPAHNQAQITFAYKWYRDDSEDGWRMSADFKRTFSIDVNVHFLGCWDTVASVGIVPRILPFAKTNNAAVRYFRHALALDERRAKFKANHWFQRGPNAEGTQRQTQETAKDAKVDPNSAASQENHTLHKGFQRAYDSHKRRQGINNESLMPLSRPSLGVFGEIPEIQDQTIPNQEHGQVHEQHGERLEEQGRPSASAHPRRPTRRMSLPVRAISRSESSGLLSSEQSGKETKDSKDNDKDDKERKQNELMKEFLKADALEFGAHDKETDVLEVWFLGCHADCGGGAVPNETRHMLSRIPLRWMLRQTFQCDTGLLFHTDVLAEHGLDVETLWPTLQERKAPLVAPAPSALDRYATGDLPSLAVRRDSIRRRSLLASSLGTPSLSDSPSTKSGSGSGGIKDLLDGGVAAHAGEHDILPEHHEDYFDALSPINDQLELSWPWWILEWWPVKYRVKVGDGLGWKKKTGPNRGRHRAIRDAAPHVHWTVSERSRVMSYRIKCPTDADIQWRTVY